MLNKKTQTPAGYTRGKDFLKRDSEQFRFREGGKERGEHQEKIHAATARL